jgi:hypothetical protein
MRKIAILITLTMLLASLAGCAGDAMIMHFIEDGTLTDG